MWNSFLEDETDQPKKKNLTAEEEDSKESLIKFLSAENYRYRTEIDALELSKQSAIFKYAECEKSRQALLHDLQKAKDELKFEVMAREGITKRANTFEFENFGLKDNVQLLLGDQSLNQQRMKALEKDLSLERMKRLKDLHEIDLLKKSNAELVKNRLDAESDMRNAQMSLIEKLQKTETVLCANESQKRLLEAESEEIHLLTSENTSLKENISHLYDECQKQRREIEEWKGKCKSLDNEVKRLHGEIVNGNILQGDRSRAFNPLPSQLEGAKSISAPDWGGSRATSSALSQACTTASRWSSAFLGIIAAIDKYGSGK